MYPSLPRSEAAKLPAGAITATPYHGGGGKYVIYSNRPRPGFKSTAENSAHRPSLLTSAEKARRVAELRAALRAPIFQALVAAAQGRDLS